MANLLDGIRGALLEGIDSTWQAIEDQLREGLGEVLHGEELQILKDKAIETDRLILENAQLRTQLQSLHPGPLPNPGVDRNGHDDQGGVVASIDLSIHGNRPVSSTAHALVQNSTVGRLAALPTPTLTGDTAVDNPELTASGLEKDWQLEHDKLAARYNALRKEFSKARDALKKRTQETERWIKYAESLEKSLGRRRLKQPTELSTTTISTTMSSNTRSSSSSALDVTESDSTSVERPNSHISFNATTTPHSDRTSILATSVYEASTVCRPASEIVLQAAAIPGSDSTDDALPELPIPSSAIGSEVVIKPEPSSDVPMVVYERSVQKRRRLTDGDCRNAPKLKSEADSDGHFDPDESGSLQESLDLDEVGKRMATPRKQRNHLLFNILSDSSIIDGSSSSAASDEPARSDPSKEAPSTNATLVLQPISGNKVLTLVRGDRNSTVQKKAKNRLRLGQGISSLAEDGDGFVSNNLADIADILNGPPSSGRLQSLLHTTTSRSEPPLIRPTRKRQIKSTSYPGELQRPGREQLQSPLLSVTRLHSEEVQTPQSTNSSSTTRRSVVTPQLPRPGGPLPTVGSAPPRLREPSALRLSDFKINPKFNEGHDYAFSEVVRGKEARASLPGCTDKDCCGGQFLALARAHASSRPDTPDQRQQDQNLLEDYLGEERTRLDGLGAREWEELYVEAKAWELANRHGKHRHRFARAKSPPGFWRMDFPDTQEAAADRAEAEKREKEQIQERLREAMRPNGRWTFRDE